MQNEQILAIPVTVDKDHIVTIGERLYGESIELVRELVNNTYDADATRVDITVDGKKIVVEDNGNGMSLEELKQYFNIGSSHKRRQKKSPKFEREMIGQFGIGKFASLAACKRFEVWTKKGNFCGAVTFDKNDWKKSKRNWYLPLRLFTPSAGRVDGTRITLTGLTKKFKIEDIKSRLRETVPLSVHNFSVYLNEKKITPYYVAGRSIPFMEGTKYGAVHGEIVIVTRGPFPDKPSGIECKVKHVMVKREFFGLESISGIARKIYGVVNADFLPVTSDRTGFIIDCPEYRAFQEVMKNVVVRVKEEIKVLSDERQNRKVNRRLKEAMRRVEDALIHNPELCPSSLTPVGDEEGEQSGVLKKKHQIGETEGDEEEAGVESESIEEREGVDKKEVGKGADKKKPRKKKRPTIKPLTTTALVKELKAKRFGVTCVIDHFGEDGPECFTQGTVVHINRDHPVYREAYKNRSSYVMHLARLLTQEISLLARVSDPHIAYTYQSRLMRDAFRRPFKI
ncbi:ATP-binding protein [Candidatus Aerophobetes bacterium]|nr:ATP-binding protein [Candidatus Aerophobetes bacterium]